MTIKVLREEDTLIVKVDDRASTAALNCKRDGHDLTESTDPYHWWCPRCGNYIEKVAGKAFI